MSMEAKCPKCLGTDPACPDCLGTGMLQARLAQGDPFTLDCLDCGRNIGGGILGGESPTKELPPDRPCVFCGGTVRSFKEGQGC